MNKKRLIAICVIVLIIAITCIVLLVNLKSNGKENQIEKIDTSLTDVVTKDESYDVVIPDGYTVIDKEGVTSPHNVYVEAVAYKVDNGTTYVRVYFKNIGSVPISKDAICSITMYDSTGTKTYKFGGLIENPLDIKTGETSVVRTQFIEEAYNIYSVKIDFDNNDVTNVSSDVS